MKRVSTGGVWIRSLFKGYLYILKESDARRFQLFALTCIILHVGRQPA